MPRPGAISPKGVAGGRAVSRTGGHDRPAPRTPATSELIKIQGDGTKPSEAANFMIVAYSTFSQPSRPNPKIMALPVELPPMRGSFVACVLEERQGSSVPRAAIIFKADVSFDCPQMADFILQLIDSVDVIRKLSRQSNARVVASRFELKNPLAELDREQCEEIFYWQYLGHTERSDYGLM